MTRCTRVARTAFCLVVIAVAAVAGDDQETRQAVERSAGNVAPALQERRPANPGEVQGPAIQVEIALVQFDAPVERPEAITLWEIWSLIKATFIGFLRFYKQTQDTILSLFVLKMKKFVI